MGQSIEPLKRFKSHISPRGLHGNLSKAVWLHDMESADIQPIMEILEVCGSVRAANEAERRWIKKFIEEDHPLQNLAEGGTNIRRASKMGISRKRDWIELGYMVKTAREATMKAMCDLSAMIPKGAEEVRLLESAFNTIDKACYRLDNRLFFEYPTWEDFTKVFFGSGVQGHCENLKNQLADENPGPVASESTNPND